MLGAALIRGVVNESADACDVDLERRRHSSDVQRTSHTLLPLASRGVSAGRRAENDRQAASEGATEDARDSHKLFVQDDCRRHCGMHRVRRGYGTRRRPVLARARGLDEPPLLLRTQGEATMTGMVQDAMRKYTGCGLTVLEEALHSAHASRFSRARGAFTR